MRFVIILILLCASLGFSCRQGAKQISPEMAMIDSIMWDHPDSALTLLEKMPKPSPSDKLNDATWCLLYTQAQDKTYKKHTSDSLINISLRYFDTREDGRRKAQAWFYKGAVCRDLSRLEDATACYVKAKDLVESVDNPLFASLICQTLGRVYREQHIYDKAFELFREAVSYVTQVPRRDDWSHAYSELGRTFAECKQLDSARYYFECSLENGVLIDDLRTQAMAIGELGVVYRFKGDYGKALELTKKKLAIAELIGIDESILTAKYSLGGIFYYMGMQDSAKKYFQESLSSSNIYTKRGAYKILYILSRKQGKNEEAIDYNEQYCHYNDSINNIDRTRAIAEAQEKYDNEKLENEKKTLLLEKEQLQKSILWGGIIMVVLIGLIAFGYQRKLWLKERSLRKSEEDIQEYLSNLHDNEEMIFKKQALIQSLSRELEDKENLAGVVNEQIEQIDRLRSDTEYLESQNREYQCQIDEYIQSAKQNEARVIKLEKLSNQNLFLKGREAFLIDYINKHVDLFKMLRENPRKFVDWTLLYESMDILHNSFYSRLKKEFPSLNEMDLQVCCLIKIGLATSQIAEVICITGPSVTKKKYRIRERMNQCKEESSDANITLDVFLINY